MIVKIFVKEMRLGRLQMPNRDYERSTPHGATSIKNGILVDDPVYREEKSQRAVKVAMEFADKHGIKYKVYNHSSDWAELYAWFKGIKVYPTIILGKRKIEGVPRLDELENILLNN